jgi:hypothetical protein
LVHENAYGRKTVAPAQRNAPWENFTIEMPLILEPEQFGPWLDCEAINSAGAGMSASIAASTKHLPVPGQ